MKIPSAPRFPLFGSVTLGVALLLAAGAASARAQRMETQTAGPAGVRPPLPAGTVRVATPPASPVTTQPGQAARNPGARPIRPPIPHVRPPLRPVQPITVPPMATPADSGGIGAQERIIFAGKLASSARHLDRNGITPVRFPPPTRRLLLSPPPVSTLTTAKPVAIPGVSPLPRVNGIPPLPPGAKIYCSPWSVLYNTGSICFNPDTETINPDFYPWGLFSAPAFVNVPGYIPPFPLGMLIQPCPQCATAGAGLRPPLTPIDRWHRATSGSIAGLGGYPRLAAPAEVVRRAMVAPPAAVKLEGPPVVLVLKNGTRELVSRYWLGQDWLLHFITVSGSRRAIPLGQLNLKETGSVNYGRGVTFVMPAWPEPRSSR